MFANGIDQRIEFEDGLIRLVGKGHSNFHYEMKVSSILNVTLKKSGLIPVGVLVFVVPQGQQPVAFLQKSLGEFQAIRDAVIKLIDDERRFGAYLDAVLKPGFTGPPTTPETPGVEVRFNYRIGEIRREFDSHTVGAIQGAMHHELGLHGSFTSVRMGKLGIGLGQLRLSGMTDVDLKTSATTRSDFLNDGFVAVFDEPTKTGVPETLRVIVPSEEACRERITDYVNSMYVQMGLSRFGHSHDQLITAAAKSVTSDISYVSDRLSAVLRTNADKTSVFNVVGIMCGQHMMLGGAIQMPGDDRWLQLFPVGLLRILSMPLVDGGTT